MGKIGGTRNYGYGKQLAWAGKSALKDRYGEGHYSTRATHEERWQQFVHYLKSEGINDARKIDKALLNQYAEQLKTEVNSQAMSVSYAQNLLSTVNVIVETLRKDEVLHLSPVDLVGVRSHVRSTVPATLNRQALNTPLDLLLKNGQERTAILVQLTRSLGLRFKEASMLDARKALRQANRLGRVNITQGTKGGRGKGADRWVPVNKENLAILKQAALRQPKYQKNLIPEDKTYVQWRDQAYYQWRTATKDTDIQGFHDMRAAYACERYQQLTGYPAPVITQGRRADKAVDRQARAILSQELGHGRLDVIAAYLGT